MKPGEKRTIPFPGGQISSFFYKINIDNVSRILCIR